MRNFSCSFGRLYGNGGFYGGAELAGTLIDIADACRWCANLYPPYQYPRPAPVRLIGDDPAQVAGVSAAFAQWDAQYAHGSSTDLFALDNALLFNRCVYSAYGGEIVQMYETNRPNDRPWRRDLDPLADLDGVQRLRDDGRAYLYLGSIGSQNYGHWLIDDLTRARSIVAHFPAGRLPTIVLNSYNPVIDAIRAESLHVLAAGAGAIEVLFLDYRCAYAFSRLFIVSPSTDHPMLKSPDGVAFVRDHFARAAAGDGARRPERLFVTRRAGWRNMRNLDDVCAYFMRRGFEIVELTGLSFADQIRTFAHARVVVGSSGAGMANTVFSPPGCTVVHLAPAGWTDPFFWDLAAVAGHAYAAVFGAAEIPAAPAFSPFSIAPRQLDELCSDLP